MICLQHPFIENFFINNPELPLEESLLRLQQLLLLVLAVRHVPDPFNGIKRMLKKYISDMSKDV